VDVIVTNWDTDSSGVVWRRVGCEIEAQVPIRIWDDFINHRIIKIPVLHDFKLADVQVSNIIHFSAPSPFGQYKGVIAKVVDWEPLKNVDIAVVLDIITDKQLLGVHLVSDDRSIRAIANAIARTYGGQDGE